MSEYFYSYHITHYERTDETTYQADLREDKIKTLCGLQVHSYFTHGHIHNDVAVSPGFVWFKDNKNWANRLDTVNLCEDCTLISFGIEAEENQCTTPK